MGPVDIVYTWVNGSDPMLQQDVKYYKKKDAHIYLVGDNAKTEESTADGEQQSGEEVDEASSNDTESSNTEASSVDFIASFESTLKESGGEEGGSDSEDGPVKKDMSRYRDNQELRYSLRSIWKFAPWVRNVYIVTNGQVPYWLDLKHPRLKVIPHRDIYVNKSHLPSFSSPSIESNLHRIPGLADRFVYFNDDVMLGNNVWPDDFYTHGKGQKVFLSWDVPPCADGCPDTWVGDKFCDASCNNEACSWDGGDCLASANANNNGNNNQGSTQNSDSSNRFSRWQGGRPGQSHSLQNRYCTTGCPVTWVGDMACDRACNTYDCGFDGGDCGLEDIERKLPKVVFEDENDRTVSLEDGTTVFYIDLGATFSKVTDAIHENPIFVRSAIVTSSLNVMTVIVASPTSLEDTKDYVPEVTFTITGFPVEKPEASESEETGDPDPLTDTSDDASEGNSDAVDSEEASEGGEGASPTIAAPAEPVEISRNITIHVFFDVNVTESSNGDAETAETVIAPTTTSSLLSTLNSKLQAESPIAAALNAHGVGEQHDQDHDIPHMLGDDFGGVKTDGDIPAPTPSSDTPRTGGASTSVDNQETHHDAFGAADDADAPSHAHTAGGNEGLEVDESHDDESDEDEMMLFNEGFVEPHYEDDGGAGRRLLSAASVVVEGIVPIENGQRLNVRMRDEMSDEDKDFADRIAQLKAKELSMFLEEDVETLLKEAMQEKQEEYNRKGIDKQVFPWDVKLRADAKALARFGIKPSSVASKGQRRLLMDTFGESLRFVNRIYSEYFGRAARKVPAHMPHFIDRRIMEELQATWPKEFDATSSHRFRHPHDMQFAFSYFYYMMHKKEEFSLDSLFPTLDYDHDGFLDLPEVKYLSMFMFGRTEHLMAPNLKQTKNMLRNCTLEFYSLDRVDKTGRENWLRIPDKKYPITKDVIASCDSILEKLKEQVTKKHKYKHELENMQNVEFYMVKDVNHTIVENRLNGIRAKAPKFICLNDDMNKTHDPDPLCVKALHDFYEEYVPEPCPFELPVEEYRNVYHIDDIYLLELYARLKSGAVISLAVMALAYGLWLLYRPRLKHVVSLADDHSS